MSKKSKQELDELPKYKNSNNSHLYPIFGESGTGISTTVPDQSMPIAKLIQRYASGLPMSGVKVPLYEDPESEFAGINIATMDLAEREELFKEAKARYDEALANIRKAEQQQAIKDQQKRVDEQVQHQLALAAKEKQEPPKQ